MNVHRSGVRARIVALQNIQNYERYNSAVNSGELTISAIYGEVLTQVFGFVIITCV